MYTFRFYWGWGCRGDIINCNFIPTFFFIKISNTTTTSINTTTTNATNTTADKLSTKTKKKDTIYHAAMLDPLTASILSIDEIFKMTNELLFAHQKYLPEYN